MASAKEYYDKMSTVMMKLMMMIKKINKKYSLNFWFKGNVALFISGAWTVAIVPHLQIGVYVPLVS
jgi:hypothetical protein